jgi:hypothetical protein
MVYVKNNSTFSFILIQKQLINLADDFVYFFLLLYTHL